MTVKELFEKHDDEYLCFDKVENKLSNRPDLHALLLLDKFFPDTKDIINGADANEIYLSIEKEQIKTLTEAQVIDLVRAGIGYGSDGYLSIFL